VNADRGGTAVGVVYQGPGVARLPVRLLPRPLLLAGREGLLADVGTRLDSGGRGGPGVVALYGLGGAGKTSLALEYAYRQLAGLGVAWLLPAEDPATLTAAFGDLADVLGARDLLTGGDPVAQVHAALAAWPADWLLVFDSAPDWGSVREVLPPAGRGRVLVTTQDARWPGSQAVDVPCLDPEVAAGFLLARTSSADKASALDLAGAVGGLRGRAAAGPGPGRRLHAGQPPPPWPPTCNCSGNGRPTCWPAARPPVTRRT
jgi:hypothetical protein